MKPQSAKNKGRRFQQQIAKRLADFYELKYGQDEDFFSRGMGQQGIDIPMSHRAREICPFDPECKNVEKLNIWKAIEQAEENSREGRIPTVFFTRNHTPTYVAFRFEDLLKLIKND